MCSALSAQVQCWGTRSLHLKKLPIKEKLQQWRGRSGLQRILRSRFKLITTKMGKKSKVCNGPGAWGRWSLLACKGREVAMETLGSRSGKLEMQLRFRCVSCQKIKVWVLTIDSHLWVRGTTNCYFVNVHVNVTYRADFNNSSLNLNFWTSGCYYAQRFEVMELARYVTLVWILSQNSNFDFLA